MRVIIEVLQQGKLKRLSQPVKSQAEAEALLAQVLDRWVVTEAWLETGRQAKPKRLDW